MDFVSDIITIFKDLNFSRLIVLIIYTLIIKTILKALFPPTITNNSTYLKSQPSILRSNRETYSYHLVYLHSNFSIAGSLTDVSPSDTKLHTTRVLSKTNIVGTISVLDRAPVFSSTLFLVCIPGGVCSRSTGCPLIDQKISKA